ncbi:MAG: sigma-70 family RNA polymerase sigma factor [bacterium]|nr:sigma-70 family RNA polymerase sigma factor [bacterium]
MKSLTQEQSKLVTDSYRLVKFAVRSISAMCNGNASLMEELEGVAAVELCKAAINYDAERGSFDDYAFVCMRLGMISYLRKEFSHGMSVGKQSLEELSQLSFTSNLDYEKGKTDDSIEMLEGLTELERTLNEKEQILYILRYVKGLTTDTIKSKMGISSSTFHRINGNVKRKVAAAFDWNIPEQMLATV